MYASGKSLGGVDRRSAKLVVSMFAEISRRDCFTDNLGPSCRCGSLLFGQPCLKGSVSDLHLLEHEHRLLSVCVCVCVCVYVCVCVCVCVLLRKSGM